MRLLALQRGRNSRSARTDFCPSRVSICRPEFREAVVPQRRDEEHPMMDILMLVLAAAFFALAIGYTYACERL